MKRIEERSPGSAEAALKRRLAEKDLAIRECLLQFGAERDRVLREIALTVDRRIIPLVRRVSRLCRDLPCRRQLRLVEDRLRDLGRSPAPAWRGPLARLSPREAELCELFRGGASTKEAAEQLSLSEETVAAHRRRIRRKLGLRGKKLNLVTVLRR